MMSFDFITEHQGHFLLRIVIGAVLSLGFFAFLSYWVKRHLREKENSARGKHPTVEIDNKNGWRTKPKRRKGRR